jgi:hypothetical protein
MKQIRFRLYAVSLVLFGIWMLLGSIRPLFEGRGTNIFDLINLVIGGVVFGASVIAAIILLRVS